MNVPVALHQRLSDRSFALLRANRFVLVCPSHAGNIGSVARAMRTMGLTELAVVAPRDRAFADDRQALALASGAVGLLRAARVFDTLEQALADCQTVVAVSAEPREFGPPPEPPARAVAATLAELRSARAMRVAWVFGTERTGLSIREMQACQRLATIPADPEHASLNLSQAAQIVAFALRQQLLLDDTDALPADKPATDAPATDGPGTLSPGTDSPATDAATSARLADHAAIEGFHAHLERALLAIGYLDPAHPKRLMPRLRRLFTRARLEAEEIDLLRGICKLMERRP